MSVAFSLAAALQSGRSTLAVAGVFGAGKTRSLTFLLVWLALTTNLKIGVVHKENPAGRAITQLLGSLALDNEQAKLFVRAVRREEHMANAASTRYDIAMQHCSGAIPKAKVVIATTGLVWKQKAHVRLTFWFGKKRRYGPQVCVRPGHSSTTVPSVTLW